MKNIVIPDKYSRLHKDTQITVPVAAMVHHKNMVMDEVTIVVHGKLGKKDGETSIELGVKNDASETLDEIKLIYRCQHPTEETEKVIRGLSDNIR